MSDKRTQGGLSQPTGVFEVIQEIEEIGARESDLIVLRPWADRPAVLQRTIDPRWAFGARCSLFYTDPPMMDGLALRLLREGVDGHGPVLGSDHLTLLP